MNALNRIPPPLRAFAKNTWAVLWRAIRKYDETDGEQRAASFAYYAFFALFPLLVLLITLGSMFLGNQQAASDTITEQLTHYLPDSVEVGESLVSTINGALKSRSQAGFIAFGVLAWSSLRFFQSLVHGVNRAWGTKEYSWWRLPIKNLLMVAILASALFFGIVLPAVVDQIRDLYWKNSWQVGLDFKWMAEVFRILRLLVSPVVLYYGFTMFYKYAPRRRTTFREVWLASLIVTVGLGLVQWGFALYIQNFANFNKLYGTFGSVIALLMWIYLSGAIIILGGCLCAARYEIKMQLSDQAVPNRED